jgi:7-cyano-7-deazaguanine synthase in queuosine biosynthesis
MLMMLRKTHDVAAIFFDRGQSNAKSERAAVRLVTGATWANCHLDEVDITSWWRATQGKVRMIDVPRNPIFALLASPFAISQSCTELAIGSTLLDANTGDSNEKFVFAYNALIDAMHLERVPRLTAPLLELSWDKASVANWARENLGEEFIAVTHSCWKEVPCNVCSACVARETALGTSKS